MYTDILGKIVVILTNLPDKMSGGLLDLVTKLNSPDGLRWFEELMKFLRKEPCWLTARTNFYRFFRAVAPGTIKATAGKRTFVEVKDFFSRFDPSFESWGTNVPGEPRAETPFEIYEIGMDGTLAQIFGALGVDLDKLCWSQDQIITFVEDHAELLHPKVGATFFLFKVYDKFFVADVDQYNGGSAIVKTLSCEHVWGGMCLNRFVVPQQP